MSWQSFSRWSALLMLGQAFTPSYFGDSGVSPASSVGLAAIASSIGAVVFGIIAAVGAWRCSARQQAVLLILATAFYSVACLTMLASAFAIRWPSALRSDVAIGLLVMCLMVTGLLGERPAKQLN